MTIRGSWKWDDNAGALVPRDEVDKNIAEEMRQEKERLARQLEQDEKDTHPGVYI